MKKILLSALSSLLCLSLTAQGYEKHVFVSELGTELPYRLLKPVPKGNSVKYPVVLFLHGAGERGNDNSAQLVHGSGMFLNPSNADKYPAYVIFPQCPNELTWAYDNAPSWKRGPFDMPADHPESTMEKALMGLLREFIASHPDVDTRRIYIMGLSMGGIGTYDIVSRYPDLFAAAVPICGCVNPGKLAPAAKTVKFSIYHGDKDNVVPVEGSREAYKALKKAGATVKYKEFVGCSHGSWDPAFNEPDFLSWLFKQRKRNNGDI